MMVQRCALVTAFALGVTLCGSCHAPDTHKPWQGVFEAGPYPVGFQSETLVRTTSDGARRTLSLSVWYPAAAGTGQSARVGDLFEIVLQEEQLSETEGLSVARGLVAAMTGDAEAVSVESAEQALAMQTLSWIGAEAATGDFPLAMWSSRHATVLAQAPFSEALASQGTVVATVWSSDPPLAFLWEDRPESEKLETIAIQTDDLQYALSLLRNRQGVDPDRTVILSWSYGGQTAARLQERDRGVVGVIGLDANVVPARPEERLLLRVPLVWLLGQDSTGRGLESASSLTAPSVVVALPGITHGNFNALEGFLPGLLGAETVFPWSTGGQMAVDGYAAVVRIGIEAARGLVEPDASIDDLWRRASVAARDVPVRLVHDSAKP